MLTVYFAVPSRFVRLVPKPLQVSGLPAGSARCDQQIASVLEKQSDQLRVVARPKAADARVDRGFHGIGRAKIQADTAEKILMITDVVDAEILVVFRADEVQYLCVSLPGIAGNVSIVDEVGSTREQQSRAARRFHKDRIPVEFKPAVSLNRQASLESDRTVGHLPGHDQIFSSPFHRSFLVSADQRSSK